MAISPEYLCVLVFKIMDAPKNQLVYQLKQCANSC